MRDEALGELSVSDSELSLTVRSPFGPTKLTVRLEGAAVSEAIEAARDIVATLGTRVLRAQEELTVSILPVVNGGYLGPGEAPLSREDFLRRAQLREVRADVDGKTSFHFNDDEMLWGHRIVVDCDRDALRWSTRVAD